ncbi:ATPase, AAA family protein [Cryptosporidium felis]|nr:ATPase, AAA family protein [Cryptosporidium felis]
MDEIDGLGGSDRGGAAALGRLIQKTRWPIICICNDRMSEKVRSLASKCYDLRFSRPSKVQIIKRMQEIAAKEGMSVEPNAIELLCESVGNDLRQILNELQLLSLSNSNVRFSDVKSEVSGSLKDVQVTLDVFSAVKRLLNSNESSQLSIQDKLDIFFIDFDLMPLLLEENYIAALSPKSGHGSSAQAIVSRPDALESILGSANLFLESDIFNSKLRTDNEWSLLSEIAINCAVLPGFLTHNSFIAKPEFPKWLGKNSTKNKNKRFLSELMAVITVGTKGNCPSSKELRLSGYLDLIYFRATAPLLDNNMDTKDAIQASISVLDEYCLSRNHITEHITSLMLKNQVKAYDKVDSKVKSAMTRVINSSSHAVKVSFQSSMKNMPSNFGTGFRDRDNDYDEEGARPRSGDGEGGSESAEDDQEDRSKSGTSEDLGSLIKVKKTGVGGTRSGQKKRPRKAPK